MLRQISGKLFKVLWVFFHNIHAVISILGRNLTGGIMRRSSMNVSSSLSARIVSSALANLQLPLDIETQNVKNIPGARKISLETIMIGHSTPFPKSE